jgi:uncharacterized protein (DUF58 family)
VIKRLAVRQPAGVQRQPVQSEPATTETHLRRLELLVTRRLDGLLRGEHAGLVPGGGTEPSGSREYRPGEDDARRMDWAVTARTATPHVQQTVADRELVVWAVVDGSASMDFGTADVEKRQLAVAAVAAIGFLTAGVGNRLGADIVVPGGVQRVPARAGRAHLIGLLGRLTSAPRVAPGGPPADLGTALEGTARVMRRRGLVVVVSDFLEPGWERPLQRLGVRHQVLGVEVLDPRELELPDVGLITLVDPETGRRLEVSTADPGLRLRYAEAAAQHRAQVRDGIRRAGATHLQLRTDRDWLADIVRHVHEQRRLARAPVLRGAS